MLVFTLALHPSMIQPFIHCQLARQWHSHEHFPLLPCVATYGWYAGLSFTLIFTLTVHFFPLSCDSLPNCFVIFFPESTIVIVLPRKFCEVANCLHVNMDKLLLHCDTCDAKLISSDQKEFLVHKAVVASASDVLKLHFFSCHQNTSVYQMECKSNALVHIIDFIYKGQNGVPISWYHRFCAWHPESKKKAVEDWVDLIVAIYANATKLRMTQLKRIILLHNYKFFLTFPGEAELVIPVMHERSMSVTGAQDLQLLSHCCCVCSRHFGNKELLTHGKNETVEFPKFATDLIIEKFNSGINSNEKGIIVLLCSSHDPMNGF